MKEIDIWIPDIHQRQLGDDMSISKCVAVWGKICRKMQ